MNLRLLLLSLASALSLAASAFLVENSEGKAIAYRVTSAKSVALTYDPEADYTGRLIVPKSVTFDARTYVVSAVDDYACVGCTQLREIELPTSVTSIGCGAFTQCTALQRFSGKFASTDGRALVVYSRLMAFAPADLSAYAVPASVTSIGPEAFASCTSLLTVDLPASLTTICDKAFYNCQALESITIPNPVSTIGTEAFAYCDRLATLVLPSTLTSVASYAFNPCPALKLVKVYASEPPTCATSTFAKSRLPEMELSVPVHLIDAYYNAEPWIYFGRITTFDTPGDANGDGRLTIADAVVTVAFILGDAPATFRFSAADLTGDSAITISDVVAIVSLIL